MKARKLVRQAIKFALEKRLPSVTLVHKGNIMKFTEGSFMKWGYALAEREFADKVFTWDQYKKITSTQGEKAADEAQSVAVSQGKLIIKDRSRMLSFSRSLHVPPTIQ